MNHGIGYQFKIINDRIKVRADADLKTHDLTLTQTRVLGFLTESGGQATQKEIEADLQDKMLLRGLSEQQVDELRNCLARIIRNLEQE